MPGEHSSTSCMNARSSPARSAATSADSSARERRAASTVPSSPGHAERFNPPLPGGGYPSAIGARRCSGARGGVAFRGRPASCTSFTQLQSRWISCWISPEAAR